MLLAIAVAYAIDPVMESFAAGEVDWTNFRLVVHASSAGATGAMNNIESAEGDARAQLEPRIEQLTRAVRIDRDRSADVLLDAEDAVADRLERNVSYWEVYEARYLASGGVELDAALSLQRWLRPAMVTLATTRERPPVAGGASGLVVDARDLQVKCALAPEFLDTAGAHLFGIADMTPHAASQRPPVVYVRDPADPIAARRAGLTPVFVRPEGVRSGTDLVFGGESAAALRALMEGADVFRNGTVVVVVSP
jgi:hypothetical protein